MTAVYRVGRHVRMRLAPILAVALLLAACVSAAPQDGSTIWLDHPLAGWNTPGQMLPAAPAGDEAQAAVIRRCALDPPRTTEAERAVESAGWLPFRHLDQQLMRDDVEVVGGMRGADGMCRPLEYNLFVFVSGRFAGTLSPTPMSSRTDGSLGAVRMAPPLITADVARYGPDDALCCPSSRVTVRYRIDRLPAGPVVVPTEVRQTRP